MQTMSTSLGKRGFIDCFDGADLEFAATKKFRVFTMAVGTDAAVFDRTIGFPAGVADSDSGHGAHFELRALRELVLVRRPRPSVLEEIRNDTRHFAQIVTF